MIIKLETAKVLKKGEANRMKKQRDASKILSGPSILAHPIYSKQKLLRSDDEIQVKIT